MGCSGVAIRVLIIECFFFLGVLLAVKVATHLSGVIVQSVGDQDVALRARGLRSTCKTIVACNDLLFDTVVGAASERVGLNLR